MLGERGFEVYYPLDEDPDALCAGSAVLAMLDGDPNVGPRDQNPLSRDPRTRLELTYDCAASELRRLLMMIGEPALASRGSDRATGQLEARPSPARQPLLFRKRPGKPGEARRPDRASAFFGQR